jgi:thiamine biosynthesis lipoprotein
MEVWRYKPERFKKSLRFLKSLYLFGGNRFDKSRFFYSKLLFIKKPFIRVLLLFVSIVLLQNCRNTDTIAENTFSVHRVEGETMGTYYRVSYSGIERPELKTSLDSLLVVLNQEVSTYIPSSTISRFNYGDLPSLDQASLDAAPHFLANLQRAEEIAAVTEGYFNITIMPMVNYWGFGYTSKKPINGVDSVKVDSLMMFVGLDKYSFDQTPGQLQLTKAFPGTQIDFSAIAKGYGVDLLGDYLLQQGIKNYLVDIGGEAVAHGDKGSPDKPWRIGINTPREDAALNEIEVAVPLLNKAIATSGNYRNFYEVDGQKYSHTINPFTGYPERSNLLSASVLAKDCTTADAYATASMVMGLDKAYALIDSLPNVSGFFIYSDKQGNLQTRATSGFKLR